MPRNTLLWQSAPKKAYRRTWIPLLALAIVALAFPAFAEDNGNLTTDDSSVEEATQALLTFLTFSVIPDSTADSLQINNQTGDDPSVLLTQVGGGFNVSDGLPLYLEGYVGYARYNPNFIISGDTAAGVIEAKWRTFSATGGIGYDFRITDEWVLRPIANMSLSHMTSSSSLVGVILDGRLSDDGRDDKDWLDDGWLTAGGIGASLVLDFERQRENYEADMELRYTHYYLTSLDSFRDAVNGSTNTDTVGLWGRLRVPTGYHAFNRPVRAVFEGAHSWFANNQTEVLGFEQLSKVGLGLELDLGAKDIVVERVRLMGRYVFGKDISGVSIGFGVSF